MATRIIDLSTFTNEQGFTIQGDAAGDNLGSNVSFIGDINGDGLSDLLIGASLHDDGGSNNGAAYVIFGTAAGFADIDLSSLAASQGFKISGEAIGEASPNFLGHAAATAGDVNGDGVTDIILGAYNNSDGGGQAGAAYVIFGKTTGFTDIDLDVSIGGFKIIGDTSGDHAGTSVASAGDVNGDGYADVIVGAPQADNGATNSGEAYVIFGKAGGFGTIDLSSLAASDGFRIEGDGAFDEFGDSVSSAGDINNDGYDDIIVGAPGNDGGGTRAGAAYVIFGKSTPFSAIDVATMSASDGFKVTGDVAEDDAGTSVANLGDINGDGIDDFAIGAMFGDNNGTIAGEVYVLYGKASGLGDFDLTNITLADGFVIEGAEPVNFVGTWVSGAGDVNADGVGDLIVGAYGNGDGGAGAGAAYVIYGKTTGRTDIDLGALDQTDGFVILGDTADDKAGIRVAGGQDLNGDGIDDVAVTAPHGDDGGSNAGEVYVVYGASATGFGDRVDLTNLLPTYGFSIIGKTANDSSGAYLSDAGDVNGDGIDDVLIGAVGATHFGAANSGSAFVVFGKAGGPTTDIDLSTLTATDGFEITGEPLSQFSFRSSSAGDVNGDGIDDLIIGARAYFGTGAAYVIYGKSSGIGTIAAGSLTDADGYRITGIASGDQFGFSVASAGDINDDGFDDVIVSAPYGEDSGENNIGHSYVIFGQAADRSGFSIDTLAASDGFRIKGEADSNFAGWSVADAGDFNGDGIDDFVVSERNGDGTAINSGTAWVIFGKTTGWGDIDLGSLGAGEGFAIAGKAVNDQFGYSVAGAGDVNGDGFDDIIVGSLSDDTASAGAGAAYVIYGSASGHSDIDIDDNGATEGFAILGKSGKTYFAYDVDGVGDMNGDGYDDVVVGAYRYTETATYWGAAYVIYGGPTGFGDVDIDNLTPDRGFEIYAEVEGDYLGYDVSAAGDVNDDGLADLLVGAYFNDEGGNNAGKSYIIYGRLPGLGIDRTGTGDGQTLLGSHLDDILNGLGGEDDLQGGDGDDTLDGGDDDDRVLGGTGSDTLRGGAGRDWVRGGDDGDMVEGGDDRDWLFGDDGDDDLDGGEGADRLEGGAGADDLDGGLGGADLAVYKKSATGVTVDLGAGTGTGGDAQGDTLTGIERVMGSDHNDVLTGDGADNMLIGLGGQDILLGLDGNDRLVGGDGWDALYGGADRDILIGGEGDDYMDASFGDDKLIGGAGGDEMYGRSGIDTVLYTGSSAGVTLDLGAGTASGGDAAGDTLSEIENAQGSDFDDDITGDGGANRLIGRDGADTLSGLGGDDFLRGDAGDDTLVGGAGRDRIFGNDGADVMTGGSDGDTFVFREGDTGLGAAADRITDYEVGTDRIILRSIDADTTTGGDQAFTFGGTLTLSQSGGDTIIALDTDGDTVADAEIHLTGLLTLTAGDFVL